MNHQVLLAKYIRHVCGCEGVTFLEDDFRRRDSDGYEWSAPFTDEEWQELRRLHTEFEAELKQVRASRTGMK
jgi:hypothetical protein